MDKKEPVPLSTLLSKFFDTHLEKSDAGFNFQLWQNWPQFATTDILSATRPVSLHKGRLVLWVGSSVELQELSFHTEELKKKINTHFKKELVRDIYFTVNKELLKKRERAAKLFQKK